MFVGVIASLSDCGKCGGRGRDSGLGSTGHSGGIEDNFPDF